MPLLHIPNFYMEQRTPGQLFGRGGQPVGNDAYDWLWQIGFRNIVQLNTPEEGTDTWWTTAGGTLIMCPITTIQQVLTEPDLATVRIAVQAAKDPLTFVHCGSVQRTQAANAPGGTDLGKGGNDRTGTICLLKRVLYDHWGFQDALAEAQRFDFHPELFGLDKVIYDLLGKWPI